MIKVTKYNLVSKILKKCKKANKSQLEKVLSLLNTSKDKVEYEAIHGTFNSEKTGKIHTIIYRRKIEQPQSLFRDERGNWRHIKL